MDKSNIDKIKLESSNIADENFEKLASLFPNVVTETIVNDRIERVIDVDKLKQEINSHVVEGLEERYNFSWPDKRKSVVLANAPTRNTLRACKEESKDFDNTENLYIEGDNLEVLKLLRNTYMGQIKMIYIDPPYNTGKDFVYQDNFYINKEEYKEMSGQFDKEGNRLFENTEANGRFHTDWLNMMYPRLKMARDLLTDDGVIFISIDDNEVSNLRKICDEIFGGGNLVINKVINRPSEIATDKTIQKHEYCLVFAKNINKINLCSDFAYTISRGTVGNVKQTMPIITFPKGLKCINIADGTYLKAREIEDSKENIEVITPFIVENSYLKEDVQLKARWRSSNDMRIFFNNGCMPTKAKINGMIEEIYFDGDRLMPYIKKLINSKIPSIFLDNVRGSTELESIHLNYFSYPKSSFYIKYLLKFFTQNNDIILDFFSGSATTAHAVMQLNAEDGGNRKYIMVQLPAETPEKSEARKAGYSTICEIGKERIRRAGEKIKKDYPNANIDTGFRVFKLDSSNMEDVYYEAEKLSQQDIYKTISYIKADRSEEDLLFQIILSCGIPLKCKIEIKKVNNRDVYFVDDTYLIVCFEKDIDDKTIEELAKMQPDFMVFNQNVQDSTLANIKQIFKMISNDTNVKVI